MSRRDNRCSVCAQVGPWESITVRVYTKRAQMQYSYLPCKECRVVLLTFLEGGATAVTRGIFNPPIPLEPRKRSELSE